MAVEENVGTSRSEFLKRTAGVTGIVVGAGLWTRGAIAAPQADPVIDALTPDAAAAAASGRTFVNGNFSLELDGAASGFLKAQEGGTPSASVIFEKANGQYFQKKHIANVKYEDFTVQVGFSMSNPFYDWISAAWTGNNQRKNGAIVASDQRGNVKQRRDFSNALLTEVTIPALDASSKDPAYLTVKFAPQSTAVSPGTGTVDAGIGGKQKAFLASSFKLEIDGLDATRVSKIDAFTIKQGVVTNPVGEAGGQQAGPNEFPNLAVTMSDASSQTWSDWLDDFVVKGNSGDDKERSGKLTFLSANRQTELAAVSFFNLGIFNLTPEASENNSDKIRRVTAELYCERMEFRFGAAPPPTT